MMSVAAARKALDRGIEAGQIDTVIVSTVTHLYQTPGRHHDRERTGARAPPPSTSRRPALGFATPPRWPTRSFAVAPRSMC